MSDLSARQVAAMSLLCKDSFGLLRKGPFPSPSQVQRLGPAVKSACWTGDVTAIAIETNYFSLLAGSGGPRGEGQRIFSCWRPEEGLSWG